MNEDAASYPTSAFMTDVGHLHRAWECLNAGDLQGVSRAVDMATVTVRRTIGYQRLVAAALLSAGRLDEASDTAQRYVRARPDDFYGVEICFRICDILDSPDRLEKLAWLNRCRADLTVRHLETQVLRHGLNWPAIARAIVADPNLGDAFKARIFTFLFSALLDSAGRADVLNGLAGAQATLEPRSRVLAASIRLTWGDTVEPALSALEQLISEGSLKSADYPAVALAFNSRLGYGDATMLRVRHRFLSHLYAGWVAHLLKVMPGEHRAAIERISPPRTASRRIAIHTPPLLDINHAPSNRVYEIAVSLVRDFGYEVRIFAGGSFQLRPEGATSLVAYSSVNLAILRDGEIVHDGVRVPVWGTILDDGQPWKFATTAIEIARFQPDAVLCYGDAAPVQALLQGRLPTVLFPSNSTAPVGPADRYVTLWTEQAQAEQLEKGLWPSEIVDKIVYGATPVRLPVPTRRMERGELAPGADLVLGIVGTRLATELRGAFSRRLAQFLSGRPGVHVVTIGQANREAILGTELAPVGDRIHVFGFRTDVIDLLTGCDIALNPDRQGGGGSIAMAMSIGLPVIALDRGDSATLLEPADLACDLDDYFARLAGMLEDPAARLAAGGRMPAQIERGFGFQSGMRNLVACLEQVSAAMREASL